MIWLLPSLPYVAVVLGLLAHLFGPSQKIADVGQIAFVAGILLLLVQRFR